MKKIALWMTIGLLWVSTHAHAQEVSLSVSLYSLSYYGNDYADTDGDRAVEAIARYHSDRGWQVGAGGMVGKFDHPVSDPSFTAVTLFVEPSWSWFRDQRLQPYAGGRVAWEHERVGDQAGGLWSYGWSAGPSGGLHFLITERAFVGADAAWAILDLGRDVNDTVVSRHGHRLQVGGTVGLRW